MLHQFTMLYEVVIVASHVNGFEDIVVGVVLVEGRFDLVEQVSKVVVSNRELLKKAIHLEESKAKVQDCRVIEGFMIFKNIEVPLIEVVHQFDHNVPHSWLYIDDLLDSLLFFFKLIWVRLFILSVNLFQEIVKIPLKPLSGVV